MERGRGRKKNSRRNRIREGLSESEQSLERMKRLYKGIERLYSIGE